MPRYTQAEKEQALARLRDILKPGDTVSCILRHVSRSGMSRSISLIGADMAELDYWAARALGESIDGKHGGIRIGGCGMDMGFALVYNLASALYPHGFGCIGEQDGRRCPSNEHSNGDRDYTPHAEQYTADHKSAHGRPHWHSSGGYALHHRWL